MSTTRSKTALAFVCLFLGLAGIAAAQPPADAENCKDHPMFSRMKSFAISECKQAFDEVEFDLAEGTKTLEGQKTQISYSLVEGSPMPSPLQVRRNYGNAAKAIGGTVLYDQDRHLTARVAKGGVAPARLSSAGVGQERPVADNRTEEGRAKNRRVEIVKK